MLLARLSGLRQYYGRGVRLSRLGFYSDWNGLKAGLYLVFYILWRAGVVKFSIQNVISVQRN